MTETDERINGYSHWLITKTAWRTVNGWVEITTPYLDRHNDYIQIYLCQEENQYVLTDDGYTVNDLIQSGCLSDTPHHNVLLHSMLKHFNAQLIHEAIVIKSDAERLVPCIHQLVEAILTVLTYQGMRLYERKVTPYHSKEKTVYEKA